LIRHQYGFDPGMFFVNGSQRPEGSGLTMLFAGGAAPRKGLHYALSAWLKSPASQNGRFLIAGAFVPEYKSRLQSMLSHPTVRVLGHRRDVPDLMRKSDILILPSVEEGSALVTSEARACGCVVIVSDASGAVCTHMENALVHKAGDVGTISEHISLLYENRALLEKLREASLSTVPQITWTAGGIILLKRYRESVKAGRQSVSGI
jgi:glycosyltransferase involved in cell wall biosynthesis